MLLCWDVIKQEVLSLVCCTEGILVGVLSMGELPL